MIRIATSLIVAGISALANLAFSAEHTTPSNVDCWHGWHGHAHGFWWIFPLMMVLMFAFFFLRSGRGDWRPPWRWMGEQHYQGSSPESALSILDKRYARGEIDNQEYEEKRATLSSSNET